MRRVASTFLFTAIACYCFSFTACHIIPDWWNLGFHQCALDFEHCPSCSDVLDFSDCEEKLCTDHGGKDFVRALSVGLLAATRSCQNLHADTKWNCTTFNGDHLFGRFIENCFSRDTAMLYGYISAAITHSVASACQKGVIDGCPCVTTSGPTRVDTTTFFYQCNDNMGFAADFTRKFFNCCRTYKLLDLVKDWNIKLGIDTVINNGTSTFCRCTGLSGSCSFKTCYEKASPLEDLLKKLRMIYEGSQKVQEVNSTLRLFSNMDRSPIHGFPVHVCDRRDECIPNAELDILSTKGRECNPSSSCNSLCCSRGFESVAYNITSQTCRFEWCCRVKCVDNPPILDTKYLCL